MSRAPEQKPTLDEVVARFLAEAPTDVEAFLARHPEHAAELRELLPAMREMEEAAASLAEGLQDDGPLPPESWVAVRERLEAGVSLVSETSPSTGKRTEDLLSGIGDGRPSSERYEPRGEIARGGQGVVLAVWDRTLRRHLAMKVARASGAQPAPLASLGRFLAEAHVTARLDHPGIVPIHDLGLDAERRVFFTMKLVKGRDLGAVLELVKLGKEGWTRTRALHVLLRVCEAMAYAHSKGVIHRDLKPSNVMVGRFGEVYVMDWGLAHVAGAPAEPSPDPRTERPHPTLTQEGDVLGTPAYMSPEQARGEAVSLGPRWDVYAVGAILYQLLTGQIPFVPADTPPVQGVVLRRVLEGPPTPVSALAKDIAPELVAICEKAMARDPGQRYGDTGGLAEDLRAYLEQRVVAAYETGALAELRKWVARNRRLAAAIAAGFVAVLAGLGASLFYRSQAEERAADFLRLSARKELDDLVAEADRLWPAYPQALDSLHAWMTRANALAASLPEHEAALETVRARALPLDAAERARQRELHPSREALRREASRLAFLRRVQEAQGSRAVPRDPTPGEVGLGGPSLPEDALVLNELAWARVDPDRMRWGEEARALALARRAVALGAAAEAGVRANLRDTLAWALVGNGRFDEAMAEGLRALQEAPPERRSVLAEQQARRESAVAALRGDTSPDALAQREARILALEAEVGERWQWTFAQDGDRWWHDQLADLVRDLRSFANPDRGLLSTAVSPEHGLGVPGRIELATRLAEESRNGPEAQTAWAAALASIASLAECPAYGGLRLEPQLGLLPMGRDPDSGLWEFAHLQSGEPARRGPDGTLDLREESGLVFVLLPGGSFWMGAQSTDPNGPNFDPGARAGEGPVHRVTLSPFFLSKYEMTQGQWLRATGANPSTRGPHEWEDGLNRSGEWADLTHPVDSLSWAVADRVCRWLGCVLPSEARWEYAARAGTSTPWWTGSDAASLQGACNVADAFVASSFPRGAITADPNCPVDDGWFWSAPVDAGRANPFGLHFVHGNLSELCQDGWDLEYYGRCLLEPAIDPVAPPGPVDPSRMARDGNFARPPVQARSALRVVVLRDSSNTILGVRPALELQQARRTPR